jgi:hypothetical protein
MKLLQLRISFVMAALAWTLGPGAVFGQNALVTYQGRVLDYGTNFSGTGQFKFVVATATNGVTYWSNDGSSVAGSQPTTAVSVIVSNGLFTVALGDTTLSHMTPISTGVFQQQNLQLLIWFNDGVNGFSALNPPQRLTLAPYAGFAQNASNAVLATTATSVGANSVGPGAIQPGAVTGLNIASNNVVRSLNGLQDTVVLYPGNNVTITPSGQTLTIATSGSGAPGNTLHIVTNLVYDAGGTDTNVTINAYAAGANVVAVYNLVVKTNTFFKAPTNMPGSGGALATNDWSATINLIQDGVGGWRISFDTNWWKFSQGIVAFVPTGANSKTVLSCVNSAYGTNVNCVVSPDFR